MHSIRHILLCISILSSGLLVNGYPGKDNNNPSYSPRPYKISVSPSFIKETHAKVKSFRPTLDLPQDPWFDGPPVSNITSIVDYWIQKYDWFADQAYINSNFSHFITTVPPPGGNYNESLDIHFIHQRSARADAIPLLMLHGWPSTSLEWERVIPGLVDPQNNSLPAFHIIAPDLPGYGFSPAPKHSGLGPGEHSTIFASLMTQLGYPRYALYSTDLGVPIALNYVIQYSERIINHISDMLLVYPSDSDLARFAANQTTAEESTYILSITAFFANHSAYASVHSTYPLSLAYALNDSPVGFLSWMFQLIYTGADQVYTAAELIRAALLLYIPGVYGNIRSYKELFSLALFVPERRTSVPTSVLQFGYGDKRSPYEELKAFNYVPRPWVERSHGNITYFSRHANGGHFPALSVPDQVLADLRAIFSEQE